MRLSNGFDISASALTAQRLRMDVISSNIANAETTRGKFVNGQYRTIQEENGRYGTNASNPFQDVLDSKLGSTQCSRCKGDTK